MPNETSDDFQQSQDGINHHSEQGQAGAGEIVALDSGGQSCRLVGGRHRAQVNGVHEKVRAIVIGAHGDPQQVAHCETIDLPDPAPGEVKVRIHFAPINPADLNLIQGRYPGSLTLPGVVGGEGVGVVEALGEGVTDWGLGDLALLPKDVGAWREAANVAATRLFPLPPGLALEQAAMLRVNPATALLLLREFVTLAPQEWVLQNAANSGVGRAVISLARHFGWRTINVVRRPELIPELEALGADAVVVESEALADEVRAATGGRPLRLAFNAVGGVSALRLAECLTDEGTHVTYGAMARLPLKMSNGMLIFRDLRFRGFWVTRWYERHERDARRALLEEVFALAKAGVFHSAIEAIYPLTQIETALEHAQRGKRSGKILLRCS